MNSLTTVQPLKSGAYPACDVEVSELIQSGVDEQVAKDLYQRLTGGVEPKDKYNAAAVKSMIDTVANSTRSGGRLTPVR